MSLTVLNPQVHLVKDTGVAKFFRRKLGTDDVMTFWHSLTGQWILGLWVHQGKKIVEELEDLGPNCEAVTPSFVRMITEAYGPVDFSIKKKLLLSKNADNIRKQNDAIIEEQEKWDWLKKQTNQQSSVPYAFSSPMSGGEQVSSRGTG